jgi:hypothetical protein
MALLKGKNEQLMRANLDLSERLAAADSAGSLFNLRLSSAGEIADVICRDAAEVRISWHKAEAIAKGVLARAKNKKKTQRPAG